MAMDAPRRRRGGGEIGAPPRDAGTARRDEAILRFLADELGPGTYVNVMAQYDPAGRMGQFREIDWHYRSEFERALELAARLGLRRLDERSEATVARLPPA